VFDQEFHCLWPRFPRCNMQCSAVFGDVEVRIAVIQGAHGHAEIKQLLNALGISVSGKLRKQLATFSQKFADSPKFVELFPAALRRSPGAEIVHKRCGRPRNHLLPHRRLRLDVPRRRVALAWEIRGVRMSRGHRFSLFALPWQYLTFRLPRSSTLDRRRGLATNRSAQCRYPAAPPGAAACNAIWSSDSDQRRAPADTSCRHNRASQLCVAASWSDFQR